MDTVRLPPPCHLRADAPEQCQITAEEILAETPEIIANTQDGGTDILHRFHSIRLYTFHIVVRSFCLDQLPEGNAVPVSFGPFSTPFA